MEISALSLCKTNASWHFWTAFLSHQCMFRDISKIFKRYLHNSQTHKNHQISKWADTFSWEYNLEFKVFEPSLLFRSPWLVKSLRFGGIKYSTTNQKLPFGISLYLTIQNTINFLFFQIFVSVSLWRCTYWLKKKSHYFY